MKIEKANWQTDGDNVHVTMPVQKVDVERRLVIGFATLNNVDSQGDVVLAEASQKAFERFRGNIREMHQPIAAGKLVDFREEEFYDSESDSFYSGIIATAYVSKGAESTWEKVLDGTLTGFSIGGNILEAESQYIPDLGKSVRFVKDYELVELSLVDNPANQLANVFAIQKSANGATMTGDITNVVVENVFYCAEDGLAKATAEDAATCAGCGEEMVNIGWYEYDGKDRTEKVRNAVKKFNSGAMEKVITTNSFQSKENSTADEGGVVDVADENKELEHGTHEVDGTEVVVDNATAEDLEEAVEEVKPETEDGAEQEVEKAADVSEVEEPDFEKMVSEIRNEVSAAVAKGQEETASALAEISDKLEKAVAEFNDKVSELADQHGKLSEKFSGLKSELEGVEKRMEGVEGETAVRKSGDLGGSTEDSVSKGKESTWGGRFFSVDSL